MSQETKQGLEHEDGYFDPASEMEPSLLLRGFSRGCRYFSIVVTTNDKNHELQ
jgi:hypothetical protein